MHWNQLLNSNRIGKKPQGRQPFDAVRSAFEKDIDRIIFSYPFRRLQDKTQVIPMPAYDFVHNRLTHTLEVASVGRSLGKIAGAFVLDKYKTLQEAGFTHHDFGAIVSVASYAHDIGNPPFGHAGEKAISSFFVDNNAQYSEQELKDLQNFEGNAQGFRILTANIYDNLKLTYGTLAAFTKYPTASNAANKKSPYKSHKKYGFFASEQSIFENVAEKTGLMRRPAKNTWARHPLVFLVEAADDICYLMIDLEDAVRMQTISFDKYLALIRPIIKKQLQPDKLMAIPDFNERIAILRAMAINTLVGNVADKFCKMEPQMINGQFDAALIDEIEFSVILKEIEKFSFEKLYRSEKVLELQAAAYEVLPGLIELFITATEDIAKNKSHAKDKNKNLLGLLPTRHHGLATSNDPYLRARSIIDFISGLTDSHAVNLYRKLKGIRL